MQINLKFKDEKGNLIFDGVLNQKEAEVVLTVGINWLLANGLSPFVRDPEDATIIAEAPSQIQ